MSQQPQRQQQQQSGLHRRTGQSPTRNQQDSQSNNQNNRLQRRVSDSSDNEQQPNEPTMIFNPPTSPPLMIDPNSTAMAIINSLLSAAASITVAAEEPQIIISSNSENSSPVRIRFPASDLRSPTFNSFGFTSSIGGGSGGDMPEDLLRRYMRQVLYGCDRPGTCTNPYCASNPSFASNFSSQQLPILAAMLARSGPSNLCRPIGGVAGDDETDEAELMEQLHLLGARLHMDSVDESDTSLDRRQSGDNDDDDEDKHDKQHHREYLDQQTLGQLIETAKQTNDWHPVRSAVSSVFSSLTRLSRSFHPSGDKPSEAEGVSDAQSIRKCYEMILQCPGGQMQTSILRPLRTLIDETLADVQTCTKDNMRALIVILANPMLQDSGHHSTVLNKLCHLLDSIAFPFSTQSSNNHSILFEQDVFAKCWRDARRLGGSVAADSKEQRKEYANDLESIVSVLQLFLTLRMQFISQSHSPLTANKDQTIIDIVKCLSIFYRINCALGDVVDFKMFYNDAVNEHIEIKEDFPHWKAKEGFSFCNSPFVLTPATKSDILKVESMVQMRHELQDAFFRAMFIGVNSPYLVLDIRREFIIRDALYQLDTKSPQDLKKQLKVQFVGEEAVDEGGVQKEFFQLVVREIFDEKYGIFRRNESSNLYWFVPQPAELSDDAGLEELKLVGRLIGLAIYNGVILDIHFPIALYKKLMDVPVGLEDLKQYDSMLAKNLQTLLDFEGDVESTFGRTFQVDVESWGGSVFSHDLISNGANIPLTNSNRQEFVQLYVDFMLNKSVDRQFQSFREGFESVCKNTAITLFRPEEVELLVCGSSDLDFEALQKVTTYDGGFEADSEVIKYFWEIVHSFSEEQKKRLLFFATGTDRAPIGGLSKLNFVIARNGPDSNRLPSSHTCFNVLILPEYSSKEKLAERLVTALQNAEGFGMI